MKVMHAWHQQIEAVAHAALASTAAAMARVVCHDPHHLYHGQACCALAARARHIGWCCCAIDVVQSPHCSRIASMAAGMLAGTPIRPGKSAPAGTLQFFFRCAGQVQ